MAIYFLEVKQLCIRPLIFFLLVKHLILSKQKQDIRVQNNFLVQFLIIFLFFAYW